MESLKIYLLFTDTGSLLSKLIKLYTKKPYNHVSLAFDPELMTVYSFGRKKATNPFHGGFVKEDVRSGLFKDADCAIYSLTITAEQQVKIRSIIDEMEKHKDIYRYHFLGLFGFLLSKPISKQHAFFCSEFVATLLMECGVIYEHKPASLMSPSDLQQIPCLQLQYEGKLKDYLSTDLELDHAYQMLITE